MISYRESSSGMQYTEALEDLVCWTVRGRRNGRMANSFIWTNKSYRNTDPSWMKINASNNPHIEKKEKRKDKKDGTNNQPLSESAKSPQMLIPR